jgi:2-polyprenyl-3-methyl-5-hydroxy-6-metoxy-1,4-benzoquinol methylase
MTRTTAPRRERQRAAAVERSLRSETINRVNQRHFFEDIADHAGAAYLRYSFTKGTEQEVEFLVAALGLQPGDRVLDVGCGPGRHAHALARRGFRAHGVDIAERFVELATEHAPDGATFERLDARDLAVDGEYDAVISLCQGAFGLLLGTDDDGVLDRIARAVRPGGRVAVSGFSAYFQLRFLEATDTFDADRGVNHERATVKDEAGRDAEFDLWTTCFTPRELRLLAERAGLVAEHVWSVAPGAYRAAPPSTEAPELLLVGRRAH